jgi:hypothetical protein
MKSFLKNIKIITNSGNMYEYNNYNKTFWEELFAYFTTRAVYKRSSLVILPCRGKVFTEVVT